MENLLVAIRVVAPLFLMLLVGVLLKRLGMIAEITEKQMNRMVFRCFLPLLLFYNIYTTSLENSFDPLLLTFSIIAVLAMVILSFVLVLATEKENSRRGVMIQAMFRSNFVLFGLPVTVSLFGQQAAGIASLVIAVVVPMFNILSVIVLEIFRGGNIQPIKILRGIITNPLVIASAIGLLFLFTGLCLPYSCEKAVADLSAVATPLAFVVLGASFHFSDTRKYRRQLTIGLLGKLVLMPALFLPIAALIGIHGPQMAVVMAMLASPTAVSSYTMAQQMDGDAPLAGQLVVFGTLFSILTVFLWVFALKQAAII